MKNVKLIRAIIFMLMLSCLLVSFMGCEGSEKPNANPSENMSASESTEIEEDMSSKEDLIEKMKKDFKSETVSFTAEPFAQKVYLSWEYSLTVRIRDDQLYFGNDLYGYAVCEKNTIDVECYQMAFKDKYKDNGESLLNEINNSEYCYIAITDVETKSSRKIAIYFIDNSYYFVSFNEHNEVLRIHCVSL